MRQSFFSVIIISIMIGFIIIDFYYQNNARQSEKKLLVIRTNDYLKDQSGRIIRSLDFKEKLRQITRKKDQLLVKDQFSNIGWLDNTSVLKDSLPMKGRDGLSRDFIWTPIKEYDNHKLYINPNDKSKVVYTFSDTLFYDFLYAYEQKKVPGYKFSWLLVSTQNKINFNEKNYLILGWIKSNYIQEIEYALPFVFNDKYTYNTNLFTDDPLQNFIKLSDPFAEIKKHNNYTNFISVNHNKMLSPANYELIIIYGPKNMEILNQSFVKLLLIKFNYDAKDFFSITNQRSKKSSYLMNNTMWTIYNSKNGINNLIPKIALTKNQLKKLVYFLRKIENTFTLQNNKSLILYAFYLVTNNRNKDLNNCIDWIKKYNKFYKGVILNLNYVEQIFKIQNSIFIKKLRLKEAKKKYLSELTAYRRRLESIESEEIVLVDHEYYP